MTDERVAMKVEREYVEENFALRERVTELEWKLENVRRAWLTLTALAEEPKKVTPP